MTKRFRICFFCVVFGLIFSICAFLFWRYWSNLSLGRELRRETDEWLASLPRIPDEENGAPALHAALEPLEDVYSLLGDNETRVDSDSKAATFRQWLVENGETLSTIQHRLNARSWTFTTDYEKGMRATIPNLLRFKNCANVFAWKGDLAVFEGRQSDALREYLKILPLGATLGGERALISQMIYCAVNNIGLARILECLSQAGLNETDLEYALGLMIENHASMVDISLAYEVEYYGFMMLLADLIEGKVSSEELGGGERAESAASTGPLMLIYDFGADVEVFRRWRDMFVGIDTSRYYERTEVQKGEVDICDAVGMRTGSLRAIFAQMALPSIAEAAGVVTEVETIYRGAIAVASVRLYEARTKSLPDGIEQVEGLVPGELLIDPFSGRKLIYRKEGGDFYLYSAGYNGEDNECAQTTPIYEEGANAEMPDILFHKPGE